MEGKIIDVPKEWAAILGAQNGRLATMLNTPAAELETQHNQEKQQLNALMTDFSQQMLSMVNQIDPNDTIGTGLLLKSATFLRDYGAVECMLNSDYNFGDFGPIAAMCAAGCGYHEIVQLFLEKKPDWFSSDYFVKNNFMYPFEFAMMNGHQQTVDLLWPITSVQMINRPCVRSLISPIPPLLWALVACKQTEMIKLLLKSKPNLELKTTDGDSSLNKACFEDLFEIAKLLIDAGADVNERGITGLTPLMSAASNGNLRLVHYLLEHGADVNSDNMLYGTALMIAARADAINSDLMHLQPDYDNVCRLLLMHNADITPVHSLMKEDALLIACAVKQETIAQQLVLAGGNLHKQNVHGSSALDHANKAKFRDLTKNLDLKKKLEKHKRADLTKTLQSFRDLEKLMLEAPKTEEQKPKHKKKKKKKKKKIVQPVKIETKVEAEAESVVTTEKKKVEGEDKKGDITQQVIEEKEPTKEPEKQETKEQAIVLTKAAAPKPKPKITIFSKKRYPTDDVVKKFPQDAQGLPSNLYFVVLIPAVLNAMFGNEREDDLHKVWAAIQMGRLLLPSSKGKSGVKALSFEERKKFAGGFFKEATHKVKPNKSDVRVFLKVKLAKEQQRCEYHLDLIAPNFHAHK